MGYFSKQLKGYGIPGTVFSGPHCLPRQTMIQRKKYNFDTDHAWHCVGPDLRPTCLLRLSAMIPAVKGGAFVSKTPYTNYINDQTKQNRNKIKGTSGAKGSFLNVLWKWKSLISVSFIFMGCLRKMWWNQQSPTPPPSPHTHTHTRIFIIWTVHIQNPLFRNPGSAIVYSATTIISPGCFSLSSCCHVIVFSASSSRCRGLVSLPGYTHFIDFLMRIRFPRQHTNLLFMCLLVEFLRPVTYSTVFFVSLEPLIWPLLSQCQRTIFKF